MTARIDFAELFTHLPSPYMILDCEKRFIYANEAYLAVIGRKSEEIMGRYIFDALPEAPERLALFDDAITRAGAGEINTLVRHRFDLDLPEAEGGDRKRIIWNLHQIPVRDANGQIVGILQKALDVTAEVEAEEIREGVMRELDHRIKNLLAKIGAISELTAREESSLEVYLSKFRDRVMALGRTQSLLLHARQEADIAELLRAELSPYGEAGQAVELSGPPVSLGGSSAQSLGMAFHELSTNAVKYGALSRPDAAIRVNWSLDTEPGALTIEWAETGYAAKNPEKRGFGSTIVERLVPMDTGGKIERRFDANGHFVRFVIPLDKLNS